MENPMFWTRSGLHSLSLAQWLPSFPAPLAPAANLESAREAMLRALGEAGAARRPLLALRIRGAVSAQHLWDMRTELMMVCAQQCGEAQARRALAGVDSELEGLLPRPVKRKTAKPRRH